MLRFTFLLIIQILGSFVAVDGVYLINISDICTTISAFFLFRTLKELYYSTLGMKLATHHPPYKVLLLVCYCSRSFRNTSIRYLPISNPVGTIKYITP